VLQRLRDVAIVILVTMAILEVALRIHNPIYVPLRADQINLPINRVIRQVNLNNPKVDKYRVTTYNAIGLRGPDYPQHPQKFIKIFTVGGSTTNCYALTDGRTWPDLLAGTLKGASDKEIWLNNAGMDGHSTFGHKILLESHLRKYNPDYVIYLIGINDMERDDLSEYDVEMLKQGQSLRNIIVASSELLSTLQVLKRSWLAYEQGVNDVHPDDLQNMPSKHVRDEDRARYLEKQRDRYIPLYRQRVEALMAATRAAGARPILVTQPALFGRGIDPTTGVRIDDREFKARGIPASLKWDALELYNDVVREVARRGQIPLIDAAKEMPKDSKYYFDWVHYSNAGAELMAEIIRRGVQARIDAGNG
jgi:lysophospholipase L1-like esterase